MLCSARQSNRRGLRRWLGAIAAAIALLGQLTTTLHMAVVEHATCPEHGETVHVVRRNADRGPSSMALGAAHVKAASDESAHEHCAVGLQQRHRLSVSPAQEDRAPQPSALRARAIAGLTRPPAIALLVLAPKNSPPRSA